MKRFLSPLAILLLLAACTVPMVACAPQEEPDAEETMEEMGEAAEEMGEEMEEGMEEMGDEMEEGADDAMEGMEEMGDEMEEEMEGEPDPGVDQ